MSANLPELSRAELDIMSVLWEAGSQSVREVHNQLAEKQQWAYSTTKTMMDRMAKKGLLLRENFHGVFVYRPLVSRPAGLVRFVQFFADRVLGIDHSSVVSLFARTNRLDNAEITELQRLLELEESEKGEDKNA